ncbi:MAG: hypothetical protein H8K03_09975 [Nitrospira sp.]|jgi:hypothetical protein|nr:hypothetical protein [Nitrospira sp. BO4]
MRGMCSVAIGFLALFAVTGIVNASESFADSHRVDIIETLKGTATQSDSNPQGQQGRVDVIQSSGSGGTQYPYAKPMNH